MSLRRMELALAVMVALGVSTAALPVGAAPDDGVDRAPSPGAVVDSAGLLPADEVTLTVVYDNNPHAHGLRAEWGFACLIQGPGKTIMFDTGGDPSVLLSNMDSLSIDPAGIDIVVLSHSHGDHTGGLSKLLEANPDVTVFLPESFSSGFKQRVADAGAEVVEVEAPAEVCTGVYSTGQMGLRISEQSLALSTDRGLIVITGCAHPGIVSMVERAREVTGQDVLLVMGGFHVALAADELLNEIIEGFRAAGVAYAAPCHCSGDRARQLLAGAYGDRYIELGVGSVVHGGDLK
jgi:7,8-dihydropterin-6-yl-methyl-4-(beta-D-ribofuranosyl)aminobenzene 5'-phosphate synthase